MYRTRNAHRLPGPNNIIYYHYYYPTGKHTNVLHNRTYKFTREHKSINLFRAFYYATAATVLERSSRERTIVMIISRNATFYSINHRDMRIYLRRIIIIRCALASLNVLVSYYYAFAFSNRLPSYSYSRQLLLRLHYRGRHRK